MALSNLMAAVLNTTLLFGLSCILSHQIKPIKYGSLWVDQDFQDWKATVGLLRSLGAGSRDSGTLYALAAAAAGGWDFYITFDKNYYDAIFPKNLISFAVLTGIMYYWDLLLEYCFPTPPRGIEQVARHGTPQDAAPTPNSGWQNTLIKWIIDAVFGTYISLVICKVFGVILHASDEELSMHGILLSAGKDTPALTFSLSSVVSLYAFIKVPAPQRRIRRAGGELFCNILKCAAGLIVFWWSMESGIMQQTMRGSTKILRAWIEKERLRDKL